MSWGTATASWSSARRGPRITATRPGPARPSAKCEGSRSTAKAPRSSITRCRAKTSWTSCTLPWPNPAPHAPPSSTPSNARPKTTPCTPDPPTKITVWCAASVWWIPRRLRAIRTATRGWFELATSTLVAQQVERWTLDPRVAGSSPAEGVFKKQRQGSVMVTRRAVASEFRVRIPALSFFRWLASLVNIILKKTTVQNESSRCGLFSGGVPFSHFCLIFIFLFFYFFLIFNFFIYFFIFYFFIFYFFLNF